jgi:putative CocE/NonD family hydrolase
VERRSRTWSTAPLASNTEVSGPITLRLWASSTATDTDFVARLVDVAPDGTATQLTRGWLKATHRSSDTEPTPLDPGKAYEFIVTVWPNSNVFQAGHRIRLDLSGSDLPLI